MGRGSYHARFSGTALALVGAMVTGLSQVVPVLLAYLAAINVVTFGYYAYDKAIAGRQNVIRVPESVLHLLALLGGSPGALLGQQFLRHKTAKASFQRAFWGVLILQVGLLGWWFLRGPQAGEQEAAAVVRLVEVLG